MFPLRDNIPANRFPIVNLGIIIVNVLFFIFQLSLGHDLPQFIIKFGFIPSRFLEEQAANWIDLGRFVPVFTSMFLHGSVLHIFSNMWMLWIFGDNVEDSMGRGRYLVFYLLCGVASVVLQSIFSPASKVPMLGASGAISGVLGAYFLLYPHARILTFIPIFILFYLVEVPAYFFLGFWILLQFLQGSAQWLNTGPTAEAGIAWWAHVGGFAAGVLLIPIFKRGKWYHRKQGTGRIS